MKNKTKLLAALLMLSGMVVGSNNVFATNEYGIEYVGGEPLSPSNITVDTSLTDLTALYKKGEISFSDSSKWVHAYIKRRNTCSDYYLIRIWNNDNVSTSDNVYYTLSSSMYDVKVQINKVILDNPGDLSEDGYVYVVGVEDGHGGYADGYIGAGYSAELYEDPECTIGYDSDHVKFLSARDATKIFIQTNVKLYKHGTNELSISDKLYFGLTDIDASQSYKILSEGALLTSSSMLAMSEDVFTGGDSLNNMFVADGNYIYSESHFDNPEINNIFIKVPVETQTQGIDVVFGYATSAGSSVQYYAKQYNVQYQSDEGGEVNGITDEDIISGNLASGSDVDTKDGFELLYWVADVDVTLEDGTEIPAGDPITTEQLSEIVVSEDIVVTAIHEDHRFIVTYESDEGGEVTGITEEPVAPDGNPTGTETAPDENYEFDHWEADVDVVLEDGTEILAGEPITPEQLIQVVITENTTFVAVFESTAPAVPNTGVITKEGLSATQITVSIAAIILAAILIKVAPKVTKKKMGFDK